MAAGTEHGFTWMSIIPGINQLPDHTATAGLVAALLARHRLRRAPTAARERLIRRSRTAPLTARNLMEIFVEGFTSLVDGVVGRDGAKHAPFYGALFLFILTCNLIGLIPGFTPPTANVEHHARPRDHVVHGLQLLRLSGARRRVLEALHGPDLVARRADAAARS